jgi:hypothetical protein
MRRIRYPLGAYILRISHLFHTIFEIIAPRESCALWVTAGGRFIAAWESGARDTAH